MNLSTERNKPIFVTRPDTISFYKARGIINEALANLTAIHAKASGDFIIKASAAKKLPARTLVPINEATEIEAKELVIARLEAVGPDEKIQFLDGRTFSGPEAAEEVRKGSKVGKYFLELETETIRIVQEAFLHGELS